MVPAFSLCCRCLTQAYTPWHPLLKSLLIHSQPYWLLELSLFHQLVQLLHKAIQEYETAIAPLTRGQCLQQAYPCFNRLRYNGYFVRFKCKKISLLHDFFSPLFTTRVFTTGSFERIAKLSHKRITSQHPNLTGRSQFIFLFSEISVLLSIKAGRE